MVLTTWLDGLLKGFVRVTSRQSRVLRNRRSPNLEWLESRQVLATITVGNLLDVANGDTSSIANLMATPGADGISLREAILAANNTAGADTIVFDSSLTANGPATITLSTVGDTSAGPSAFVITSDITIQGFDPVTSANGDGITLVRDSAVSRLRFFNIAAGGTLSLDSLTLQDGRARGVDGTGNGGASAGFGGAIFNMGTLNLVNSTLSGNTAVGGNGGGGNHFSGGYGGAGLQSAAASKGLVVGGNGGGPNGGTGGSYVVGQPGGFGGGGGGGSFGGAGGFAGGAGGFGGGGGGGGFGNPGTGGAGAIGGFGGGGGGGGGGGAIGGPGTPGGAGASGGFGGGAGANGGSSTGSSGRSGSSGAGAGMGGAIFNAAGTVTITNSTLANNTAQGGTGSSPGSGLGGGIFNLNGSLTVTNVTIAANTVSGGAPDGAAVYTLGLDGTGVGGVAGSAFIALNSLFANGTGGTNEVVITNNAVRTFTENRVTRGTVPAGFTVVTSGALNLGPLQNNGGPTATMALLTGSVALNSGNTSVVSGLSTDQRGIGFTRVFNGTVDIGAYEAVTFDLGDAPDTGAGTGPGNYQTTLADNGPRHTVIAGLKLGTNLDQESNAAANAKANGDDYAGSPNDEDGVVSPLTSLVFTQGMQPRITLRATNTTGTAATLSGWVDTNGDGVFDNATERAQITVPSGSNNVPFTLTFPTVPTGFTGTTYARFRLSTDSAAAKATGYASDGEVEDYAVSIVAPSNGKPKFNGFTKIGDNINGGPSLGNQSRFGSAVASLGDLDGDGIGDIAVGSALNENPRFRGAVYIQFLNADGSVKATTRIGNGTGGGPSLVEDEYFGSALANLGDIDGDGVVDLAVGASGFDGAGLSRGAVYILRLNTNGTVKSGGITKITDGLNGGPSLTNFTFFGASIANLGDFDGDGINDLAVGASLDSSAGSFRGAVYVLRLNADGTVKTDGITKIASGIGGGPTLADSDNFGSALANLGDFDGDGIVDLAVGASGDDTGGSGIGAVYLLRLNADGTVKTGGVTKITSGGGGLTLAAGDQFGATVANVGDLDGDGVTDLVVGATGDDTGGNFAGAIHVLRLNADGTVKAGGTTKIASGRNGGPTLANYDNFGSAVTSLGDFDGDGINDLIIGSSGDRSTGGSNRGAVYILRLDIPLAPTALDLTANTIAENLNSGTAIGTFSTTDASPFDTFTYSLVTGTGGDDNAAFQIVGNELRSNMVFDFETKSSYTIRVRTTDDGGLSFEQPFTLTVTDVVEYDFGDAPDTGASTGSGDYQTLQANGGPRHLVVTGLKLGAAVDGEADGVPTAAANGDGLDEDGVVSPLIDLQFTLGSQPTIRLRATNTTGTAATLFGWIDVNGNGVFDNATERVSVVVPSGTNNAIVTLTFATLPDGFTGTTYARFRLSTDIAAANATGPAGDGEVEDYAVTITGPSTGTVKTGGATNLASGGTNMPTLANGDRFGSSVANMGDLDGDGVADLAVGAITDDTGGADRGAVHILFMNASGTVKSSTKIASATGGGPTLANNDLFGNSVANVGDLDGDGVTDLAVGARADDTGGAYRGAVHILFLSASGTVKASTKIASGTGGGPTLANNDYFGNSVTNVGDLDGDGVTDLAVGAVLDDTGGGDRGAAHILFLNASGTVKSSTKIASGTGGGPTLANSDLFGSSVANLGDLDGDGVTDLAVGASGDDTGGTTRGAVHLLRLNAVNRAPTALGLSANLIAENAAAGTAIGTFTSTDPDTGNTFTYTLVSGPGSTDNASFQIVGDQLQSAAVFDFEANSSYSIRVQTTDQGGLSFEQQFTISVTNVNDPPVITATNMTAVEDVLTNLTAISFSDPDAGAAAVTVTLTVSSGTLTSADSGGVTVGGSGTATLTLDGTISAINAFITANHVTFRTALNATASVALTIGINDNGHSGSGAPQSVSRDVTVNVSAVNDNPVNTLPSLSTSEDTPIDVTGFSISDVDSTGPFSVNVRFNTTMVGTLTFRTDVPGGLTAANILNNGTSNLTILGASLSAINATLSATNGLVYTPSENFNGIVVFAVDTNSDSNGGSDVGDTATWTVTAVNDTPTITVPASYAAQQGIATTLTGIVFADVDAGAGTVSAQLGVASGTLTAAGSGSITVTGSGTNLVTLTGTIANINSYIAGSNLSYSNPGPGAVTLSISINDNGLTGSGGAKTGSTTSSLNVAETPSLVVTTNGDVVNALDGLTSLREAITFANSNPDVSTITFGDGTSVGGTNFTDGTPDTITLSLGQITINTSLTITGNGAANTIIDGGWDGVDGSGVGSRIFLVDDGTATVQTVAITGLTLQHANSGIGNFAFNGGAIRNSENLTLSDSVLRDGYGNGGVGVHTNGTLISSRNTYTHNRGGDGGGVYLEDGTFVSTGDAFTHNVVTGLGGAILVTNGFSGAESATLINSTIANNTADAGGGIFAYGSATTINVTIANNTANIGAGFFAQTNSCVWNSQNTIVAGNTGGDVFRNGAPTINADHLLVGDNTLTGSGITSNVTYAAIFGTNVLANNGGPTQTIALAAGSAAMNAGSNALALDSSSQPLTTDQRSTGFARIIGGIVDIGAFERPNSAPTNLTLASNTIAENAGTNAVIGALAGVDPDPNDALTLSLPAGLTDNALFNLNGGNLRANASFNFEARSSYTVTVRVTDFDGLSFDKQFTISVTDVNEAPTAVALQNTTTTLPENTSTASAIKLADIVVTDDALGTNTLSLSGADAAFFEIVGTALRLKAGTVLDFETKSSYSVTVNVDDTTVGATTDATTALTLTVTNTNDAPVLDNSGYPFVILGVGARQSLAMRQGVLVSEMLARGAGGDPISDEDSGVVEGIALTAIDRTYGTFQYTLVTSGPSDSDWIDVEAAGAISATSALLLPTSARLRFKTSLVPHHEAGPQFLALESKLDAGLTFRAWDRTSGAAGDRADTTANGGTTAFSTAEETSRVNFEARLWRHYNRVAGVNVDTLQAEFEEIQRLANLYNPDAFEDRSTDSYTGFTILMSEVPELRTTQLYRLYFGVQFNSDGTETDMGYRYLTTNLAEVVELEQSGPADKRAERKGTYFREIGINSGTGIIGYIYSVQQPGTSPVTQIYRHDLVNKPTRPGGTPEGGTPTTFRLQESGDHVYTTNIPFESSRTGSWRTEALRGFARELSSNIGAAPSAIPAEAAATFVATVSPRSRPAAAASVTAVATEDVSVVITATQLSSTADLSTDLSSAPALDVGLIAVPDDAVSQVEAPPVSDESTDGAPTATTPASESADDTNSTDSLFATLAAGQTDLCPW